MTDDGLLIEAVCKSYARHQVLQDVSLAVRPGERVALLGHNGAGKTTLMKLILSLVPADAGSISIAGIPAGSDGARKAVAYLPESVSFHRSLTGREQLTLFARLAGTGRQPVAALLDRVGLSDAADRRIETWSKGMRQRLGLAQVLLGRPRAALLDEPTSGLDPISRHSLYEIIDELAARGTGVLIASHVLTEVEARTDRIAIMREGRMVVDDSLTALRQRANLPIRVRLHTRGDAADHVHARMGGRRINGASVEFFCTPSEKMDRLSKIAAMGDVIADVDMTAPSLEDIYRHYAKGDRP